MPGNRAERRQLTVLFCDLVGYTQLSVNNDPEVLREWLRYYQSICSDVVTDYGGYISRFVGDGVMVLFGYPHAHEDDAERAVRAALDIVDALKQRRNAPLFSEPMPTLAVRLGVATGQVVTGDIIGTGASEQEAIVGETPNLASRLKSLAEPNQVMVSALTQQLTADSTQCTYIGEHVLKGFKYPMPVWRVDTVQKSLAQLLDYYDSPAKALVGRAAELRTLHSLLLQLIAGTGGVVQIKGDAGVGKTRLCASFLGNYRSHLDFDVVHIKCSNHHSNTAFYPLIEDILVNADVDLDASSDEVNSHVRRWCESIGLVEEQAWTYFAALIGTCELHDADSLNGAKSSRQIMIDRLLGRFTVLTKVRPVVVVLEDTHWMDPSTAELVARLCQCTIDHQILVLMTTREMTALGSVESLLSESLSLRALDKEDAAELAQRTAKLISPADQLDASTINLICNRSDGVPLYVEELTKTALNRRTGRKSQSVFAPDKIVPVSLNDSLMSRLDCLGDAKLVAQLGATIGRAFAYAMIKELWSEDESSLLAALDVLQSAGILDQATGKQLTYSFSHVLIREVAYDSQLRSYRTGLHKSIAEILIQWREQGRLAGLEQIAQHFAYAGLPESAAKYWLLSAREALKRHAIQEAHDHAGLGLECLKQASSAVPNYPLELELQIVLGQVQIALSGHASPIARTAFLRSMQLAHQTGQENQLFEAIWGVTANHFISAKLDIHKEYSQRLLRLASQSQNHTELVVAHCSRLLNCFAMGEFKACASHFHNLSQWYDMDLGRSTADKYSLDRKVLAMQFYSQAQWIVGNHSVAVATVRSMHQHARTLEHPYTQAQAHTSGVNVYVLQEDYEGVLLSVNKGEAIARAHGNSVCVDHSRFFVGWAQAKKGDLKTGIETAEAALETYESSGAQISLPKFYAMLAELYLLARQPKRAQSLLLKAHARVVAYNERSHCAEILRLLGDSEFHSGRLRRDQARQYYQQAYATAQSQQAHSWVLRAANSWMRAEIDWNTNASCNTVRMVALETGMDRALSSIETDAACVDVLSARELLTLL